MRTEKTKLTPRLVTAGQIRFAGRMFSHPILIELNDTTVFVAYDTFVDNFIDVLSAEKRLLLTLPNRPMAIVDGEKA